MKFKNATLIVGLPGTGGVSRVSVEYLKDKLNFKKVKEIYNELLPNTVYIKDDGTLKQNSLKVFYKKINNKDVLLLIGDYQPKDYKQSYEFSKFIIEGAKKLNVKKIITIGGIGLNKETKKIIHCVYNNVKLKDEVKNIKNVVCDGNKKVKLIIGATGLLLTISKKYKINGIGFLVESNINTAIDIKAIKSMLEALSDYLKTKIDLKDINKSIKLFSKEKDSNKEEKRYIG